MTTRCFKGVDVVVVVDVEDITEAFEAFIAPLITRDNINTEDMIDDNNFVFM